MKRALIITYYWPPSGGAGVQRWLKFVKYLPGFNVVPLIVTVDPAKASYPVTDRSLVSDVPADLEVHTTSTSEPFNLYKGLLRKKEIPFAGFANEKKASLTQKFAKFIRGNLFIPDARVGWNRYAFRECSRLIEEGKVDVVITTSPPHSTQLVGLKLKKKYNIPWIADLRDPWTDIYYYSQMSHTSLAKKIDAGYERDVLENADKVITVSHRIRETLAAKSSAIDPSKIVVIPNGYDEADFGLQSAEKQDKFVITYTGTIAESYEFTNFILALKEVMSRHPEVPLKLRFAGTMPPSLKARLEEAFGDALEVKGYITHHESVQMLHHTSALLLVIPQVPDNKGILTGKLFEYLAARKPVIGIGPADGNAAAIIDECGAGRMFEPGDKQHLLEYLEKLVQDWQKKHNIDIAGDAYKKYSRKELTRRLSELINEL